ncbi:MAG: DUF3108 domain-containing protein [Pseudomonadota bacterium]
MNTKTQRRLTAVLVLLLSALPAMSCELEAFTAHYAVSNDQLDLGQSTLRVEVDQDNWTMVFDTRAEGLLALIGGGDARETSHGSCALSQENGYEIVTERYEYTRMQGRKEDRLQAQFNRSAGNVEMRRNQESATKIPMDGPVFDAQSVILQVISRLASGTWRDSSMHIFYKGKIREYLFSAGQSQRLTIAANEFETTRIVRRRDGGKRETHIWFAKDNSWIPVQIEQFKNGKLSLRLRLVSYRADSA